MFYFDYYYIVLVIPALILSLAAQAFVKGAYKKYSGVKNSRGITGAMAAQMVLNANGVSDVAIAPIGGSLTDNFNPKTKVISLSTGVYGSTSIAAVGIACHEAGHACQHNEQYTPILLRNKLIPVCNIGSTIGLPLAIVGWILGFGSLVYIGIALYAAVFVFQVATLPVEFNASKRAINIIAENRLLCGDELEGAKKVLFAAAMTYVASMIVALANLLRFIMRFSGRDRR